MKLGRSSRIGGITDGQSQIKTQWHPHDHDSQTKSPIVMPSLQSISWNEFEVASPQKSTVVEKSETQWVRHFERVLRTEVTV